MSIEEINSINSCCYEHTKEMLKSNFTQEPIKSVPVVNVLSKEKTGSKIEMKHQIMIDAFFAIVLSITIFFVFSIASMI